MYVESIILSPMVSSPILSHVKISHPRTIFQIHCLSIIIIFGSNHGSVIDHQQHFEPPLTISVIIQKLVEHESVQGQQLLQFHNITIKRYHCWETTIIRQ